MRPHVWPARLKQPETRGAMDCERQSETDADTSPWQLHVDHNDVIELVGSVPQGIELQT